MVKVESEMEESDPERQEQAQDALSLAARVNSQIAKEAAQAKPAKPARVSANKKTSKWKRGNMAAKTAAKQSSE